MNPKKTKSCLAAVILVLCLPISHPLGAQTAGATLSGTITDPAGAVVANAKVSVKNVATGQSMEAQTNSGGQYNVPNLMPGDYEVSISSDRFLAKVAKITLTPASRQTMEPTWKPRNLPDRFLAKVAKITLTPGARQTMDLALIASSGNVAPPTLGDLGFPTE